MRDVRAYSRQGQLAEPLLLSLRVFAIIACVIGRVAHTASA